MYEGNEIEAKNKSVDQKKEGASILRFIRSLESDDQKIALAVLEGMRLQKKISTQTEEAGLQKVAR